MSSALRARTSQGRLRAVLLTGLWAALAALGRERLGLARCFASGGPGRSVGRSASSAASARDQPRRVARQDAVDFKSAHVFAPSGPALLKSRLLQALHGEEATPKDLDALFRELLVAGHNQADACDATSVLDGKWNLLGAGRPGRLGTMTPWLALYSGNHFLHEGSIHNGGLFKAVLGTQAADVKLGVPRVRMKDGRVTVSVGVAAAPDREKTLTYAAEFTPISPRSFRRSLLSLELPEPVGVLTPLLESSDIVAVAYRDDNLLILQDENGYLEFLVHESVRLDSDSETMGVNTVFLQSAAFS